MASTGFLIFCGFPEYWFSYRWFFLLYSGWTRQYGTCTECLAHCFHDCCFGFAWVSVIKILYSWVQAFITHDLKAKILMVVDQYGTIEDKHLVRIGCDEETQHEGYDTRTYGCAKALR